MLKNIIFDIGMVLVDFHWKKTMRKLDIPEEAIQHLGPNMIHHSLWKELDLNIIPEQEIVEEFKKISPQYSSHIDRFFQNADDLITTYDGAAEFVQELKEKGYQVYLLSNYPARMFQLHIPKFHFYPYVDGAVVSYEYKIAKPNPEIYKLLCNKYNLKPDECIFLDDRKENIEAAKAFGFDGIVVEDPFAVRDELRDKLGI